MASSKQAGDYGKKLFNESKADEAEKIDNVQEQRGQGQLVFVGYPRLLSLPQFHQVLPSTAIQHAVICDRARPLS